MGTVERSAGSCWSKGGVGVISVKIRRAFDYITQRCWERTDVRVRVKRVCSVLNIHHKHFGSTGCDVNVVTLLLLVVYVYSAGIVAGSRRVGVGNWTLRVDVAYCSAPIRLVVMSTGVCTSAVGSISSSGWQTSLTQTTESKGMCRI